MLFTTAAEHAANPPGTWQVVKGHRCWLVQTSRGSTLDRYDTLTEAEAAKSSGVLFDLYQRESERYAPTPFVPVLVEGAA